MNEQMIAFKGEVQLLRWSETSNQGATVTFQLADPSELERFKTMTLAKKGMVGQRLAAVMVEVGDDEKPIEQPAPKQKPGELCILACTFCADKEFWKWADWEREDPCTNEAEAKQFILDKCGITSRKELDTSIAAAKVFHEEIRKPFVAWRSA
jgi:hypothetical protein